jgi:hypothetical protein
VVRPYVQDTDYDRVGRFLVRTYRTSGPHVNWLRPRWEYMHHHPYIANVDVKEIGIWETGNEIVAVVHPELFRGEAYIELSAADSDLKRDIVAYAEGHLAACSGDAAALRLYISDEDDELQHIAS